MKKEALVKSILETAGGKIQAELAGLLGCQITLSKAEVSHLSKEDFFAQSLKKLAMARLAVAGDREGESFLFTQVRDAVFLGGTLIMLPPSELEQRVAQEEFAGEDEDAFGEIANIIAGVLTTTFDEYFPDKLRFVKKEVETVVPSKVAIESSAPFPDGRFSQAAFSVTIDGVQLGTLHLLFPCELLGLTPLEQPAASATPQQATSAVTASPGAGSQAAGLAEVFRAETTAKSLQAAVVGDETGEWEPAQILPSSEKEPSSPSPPSAQMPKNPDGPAVLLLAEDVSESGSFASVLQDRGFRVHRLAIKDDVRHVLGEDSVKAVFLVMHEVTDQGFAAAIRVKSSGGHPVPLIAAGPKWTRKTVLQAVKYGVCDIVMTPATPQEIGEKVDRHLKTGT